MEAKRRLGAYLRVSTAEQAASGLGLKAQRDAIERYAALLDSEIVGEYIDAGESGGKAPEKRPEAARLLEDIRSGKLDGLVVYRLDRAFRSCADASRIAAEFEKTQRCIVSVTEAIDTMNPTGRLMLHVLASFAEFESESIKSRTKAVAERLAKEGRNRSRVAPFGWKLTGGEKPAEAHQAERTEPRRWRLTGGPDKALTNPPIDPETGEPLRVVADDRGLGSRFAREDRPKSVGFIQKGEDQPWFYELDREPTPHEAQRREFQGARDRAKIMSVFEKVAGREARQRLERDENEHRILRRMVRLRSKGLGYRRIANALNERKRDHNPRTGEPWKYDNIRTVLKTYDKRNALGVAA